MVVTFNPALGSVRGNVAFGNSKKAPAQFESLKTSAETEIKHSNKLIDGIAHYGRKLALGTMLTCASLSAFVGCQKDPDQTPVTPVSKLVPEFEEAKYHTPVKSVMAITDGASAGDSIVEVSRVNPTDLYGDKIATAYIYNNDGTGIMRQYAVSDDSRVKPLKLGEYVLTTSVDGSAVEGVTSDGLKIKNYVKNNKAHQEITRPGQSTLYRNWEFVPVNDTLTTKSDAIYGIQRFVTKIFQSAKKSVK